MIFRDNKSICAVFVDVDFKMNNTLLNGQPSIAEKFFSKGDSIMVLLSILFQIVCLKSLSNDSAKLE